MSLSSPSPQKDRGCNNAKSASSGMKKTPPPNHAARFRRGGSRWRVHQAVIGGHDHEDRVRPVYQQDDGAEQPTPLEGAEKGDDPEKPANDGEARLHHVAAAIGKLPRDKEGTIVELEARRLLRDIDIDRRSVKTAATASASCPANIFFVGSSAARTGKGWRQTLPPIAR
jgi:hypothetical protein